MKKILFLIVLCLFVTVNLFAADVITLKSGQKIEGDIIERNNDSVQIDAYSVRMTYLTDEISDINGEKISLTVKQAAPVIKKTSNIVSEPISQVTEEERIVTKTPSSVKVTTRTTSRYSSGYTFPKDGYTTRNHKPVDLSQNKALAAAGIFAGFFFIIFIIFIIFYIYSAICLQIIAKKTNTENPWLAWIPIANLFLMCKIASLSYFWLLGFLLGFVPIIGGIFTLCLTGYFWYRIGIVRSKEPQWIGALVAVPIVGLFVMGYLAFSD